EAAVPETWSVYRLELGKRTLNAVEKRGLEVHTLAEVAKQICDRETAGVFEQAPRRQRAGRVGNGRLRTAEAAEAALQRAQRHPAVDCGHHAFRPREIARLERRRQPLVQPGWHAARRERADQRVRELVREDAIELVFLLERAAHPDA